MLTVSNATRIRFFLMLLSFIAVPFVASAGGDGARVVKYSKEDVVPVHAKLRFSTLIVLPENRQMLGLLRKMGWIHHAKLSGGVYDISFDLPELT